MRKWAHVERPERGLRSFSLAPDRRRTIVGIADRYREEVEDWLANGADAWRKALGPLTPEQRQTVIDTLRAYECEVERAAPKDGS